jgi:hypothetical protein
MIMSIEAFERFSALIDRNIADLDLAIVHPKMKTGKEFPSAGIRFHVISARQVRFPSSPRLVRAPRAPSAFI